MFGVIAVHCGAGRYKQKKHNEYNKLARIACRRGVALLHSGKSALEVIKEVISILENNALTNCGFGSNLTINEEVECDASVMDGSTLLYGGCGAVQKVKNPIKLAHYICIKQLEESPFGLVPPSLLVGKGALDFARQGNIVIVKNSSLISPKALFQLKKYKEITAQNVAKVEEPKNDTVGAVCIDNNGNVASGCSSGGILLKNSGRVGQAAIYASGVWAENASKKDENSVAVCTSGCGEYIIRTQLAKAIGDDLRKSNNPTIDLSNCLNDKFLHSKYLRNISEKQCGALVLHSNADTGDVNLLWGHTSDAMGVGYMSTNDVQPKVTISKLPSGLVIGESCTVGGSYIFNSTMKTIERQKDNCAAK